VLRTEYNIKTVSNILDMRMWIGLVRFGLEISGGLSYIR
jgi:hypothetical protein